MSEDSLEAVLAAQSERFLRALSEERSVDADPIVRPDEVLDAEAYVTLLYELHHVILPALEGADLVAFDRPTGEVSRGPAFDEVDPGGDGTDPGEDVDPAIEHGLDASEVLDGLSDSGMTTADSADDDDD